MATKVGFQLESSLASKHLTDSEYIKGGYIVVNTIVERNALPIYSETSDGVIVEGSLVYVTEDKKSYRYNGSSWEEVSTDNQTIKSNGVSFGANASINLIQSDNITLTSDTENNTITIKAKDTTYSDATQTTSGLMSSEDKKKLDDYSPLSTTIGSANKGVYVNNGSIVSTTYEVNTNVPADAKFTDTTYENKEAVSGGEEVSLVTTGEKYTWNNKIDSSEKGSANGVAKLDSNSKILTSELPDYILGQLLFGGTVSLDSESYALASISSNLQNKLGITDTSIRLINQSTDDTSVSPKQYGFKTLESVYFVVSSSFTYLTYNFEVGDWLVATGLSWKKVDNTDAVTGVKGSNETDYRIGNVNITPENIGVENGAQVNKIETIKKNGTTLPISDDKSVDITIEVSDITDVSAIPWINSDWNITSSSTNGVILNKSNMGDGTSILYDSTNNHIKLPDKWITYLTNQTFDVPTITLSSSTSTYSYEYGSTVSSTFTHKETNIDNINGTLTLYKNSTAVESSIAKSSESTSISTSLSEAITSTISLVLRCTDTLGNTRSSNTISFTCYKPTYYGATSTTPITSISELTKKSSSSLGTITFESESGEYGYFVTSGTISSIKSGGFDVPFIKQDTTISVDLSGQTVAYNVYRTTSALEDGSNTMVIA